MYKQYAGELKGKKITWTWKEHPIGFPLEERDDLGGERTDPFCTCTLSYCNGDVLLRNAVTITEYPLADLGSGIKDAVEKLLTEWLQNQAAFWEA